MSAKTVGANGTSLPLSPKVLHILMALADEPMNGYQLGLRVEEASRGTIKLSPGTLYENLHRLASRGMIAEVEEGRSGTSNGRGQRFYELTSLGLDVLKAEVGRLSEDVALARSILAGSP
jgi:DNA-binding PadR family transcriptional regulator